MRKFYMLTAFAAVFGVCLAGCATSKNTDRKAGFGDVKNRVWQLSQVRHSSDKITYDHSKLNREHFNDIYTLQFLDDRAAGRAAPNRYNAPYTLNGENGLSFKAVASTLMMGVHVPDGLKENEYFKLIEKVYAWEYKNNMLLLYSKDEADKNIIMVYKEFDYR